MEDETAILEVFTDFITDADRAARRSDDVYAAPLAEIKIEAAQELLTKLLERLRADVRS